MFFDMLWFSCMSHPVPFLSVCVLFVTCLFLKPSSLYLFLSLVSSMFFYCCSFLMFLSPVPFLIDCTLRAFDVLTAVWTGVLTQL